VRYPALLAALTLLAACTTRSAPPPAAEGSATPPTTAAYFDTTGRRDLLSGGARLIPITTPKGTFNVWTKRVGNNPAVKVLLLHGGPGMTHEYFEAADSYFPGAGVEYYYYDQLGSFYSDQPSDSSLWNTERFVEEVEQVRQALGLDQDNFYLLGQSWGGILAMEYALKYQQHLKGLIIANMMASIPAYNEYAAKTLMPAMNQEVLAEVKALEAKKDYANPRYMELLIPNHYQLHVLRLPPEQWPDPVNRAFKHVNPDIYIPMQGPSELGASGKLLNWDRTADLPRLSVPTLVIGAAHDTMDPKHMEWMSTQVQRGRYLHCPDGSHLALYDDQRVFFDGVIRFLRDVDGGKF
jgi:proline iminopeptidase